MAGWHGLQDKHLRDHNGENWHLISGYVTDGHAGLLKLREIPSLKRTITLACMFRPVVPGINGFVPDVFQVTMQYPRLAYDMPSWFDEHSGDLHEFGAMATTHSGT